MEHNQDQERRELQFFFINLYFLGGEKGKGYVVNTGSFQKLGDTLHDIYIANASVETWEGRDRHFFSVKANKQRPGKVPDPFGSDQQN